MMINVFPEQQRTQPTARRAAFRLRPPAPGALIPATAVRVTPGGGTPAVEWLPETTAPAVSDLGATFVRDAVTRSLKDVARNPESARAQTNLAQAFWHTGDMDAAAEHCTIALQKDPENYVARLLLARVREVQGRPDDALVLYESAHLERPDDTPALIGLANAAIRTSQFNKAVEYLLRVVQLDPNASVPRFYLGMVLLRIGRTSEAIAHLKHGAHTDVRSPVLHHALGLAYWSQGARRRAEHQFRSALHLLPSYAPATRSLAHLLILSEKPKEAVAILEGYLTLNAESAAVRDLLGYALFEQRDYRHAIEQLKVTFNLMTRLRRGDSDLARVANNIGVSYTRLRDWKNAQDWYGRAADLDKSQPEAHRNLARVYLETNAAERAVTLLEAFRQRKDDPEASFLFALAKANLGQSQEAIGELNRLVDRDQAPGAVFSLLGTLLADEADAPARAIVVLQEGLRRFPTDQMVANNLAYALLLAGRDREARNVLEHYRESSTANIYLRATWGLLHLHEGDLDAGIAGYTEAQRLAQTRGQRDLARQAKQKMHLELAYYFLEHGNAEAAAKEVTAGLAIAGKPAYERRLTLVQRSLPDPS